VRIIDIFWKKSCIVLYFWMYTDTYVPHIIIIIIFIFIFIIIRGIFMNEYLARAVYVYPE